MINDCLLSCLPGSPDDRIGFIGPAEDRLWKNRYKVGQSTGYYPLVSKIVDRIVRKKGINTEILIDLLTV